MINKKNILLTIIFVFFVGILDTKAILSDYSYLYEITNFEINNNANGEPEVTMVGWAIANAGMCNSNECKNKYPSPTLNFERASGKGNSLKVTSTKNNSCKAEETYNYTLNAYGYKDNDTQVSTPLTINGQSPSTQIDLTYSQCPKDSKRCSAVNSYAAPCYLNVGFKFTFSLQPLIDAGANGIKLKLNINKSGNTLESFWISISKDKIKNLNSESVVESSNVAFEFRDKFTHVNLTSSRGNGWSNPGYNSSKNTSAYLRSGKSYSYEICSSRVIDGLTWYQIPVQNKSSGGWWIMATDTNKNNSVCDEKNIKKLWVPSAWTSPAPGDFKINIKDSEPKTVKTCTTNTKNQVPDTKTVEACNGNVSFSGDNSSSCSVDEYEYYTKKCYENDYKANFSINGVDDNSKTISVNNGAGITATANLSTNFSCSYTFNFEKFKADYDIVQANLNTYPNSSAEWYENYNIKTNLDNILENYMKQTTQITNWESNYNFTKFSATLHVDEDTKNLVYEDANLIHDKMDLNNDGNKEANFCLVEKSNQLNINGTTYNINTDITCGESWSVKLELPEVCLSMQDGQPENCVRESNNQLYGGRKYYLDLDKQTGNISLELKNLGYDGNWNAILKDCQYNTPTPLNNVVVFRQIELGDPFLKNYDRGRGVGRNYLNDKFDFQEIIHKDTWQDEENYDYDYKMSKVNVTNIKKDTKEDPRGSYLGRNCYFKSIDDKDKFICEFTRDMQDESLKSEDRWFTSAVFKND